MGGAEQRAIAEHPHEARARSSLLSGEVRCVPGVLVREVAARRLDVVMLVPHFNVCGSSRR